MQRWVGPMRCLGADQNQGCNSIGRGNRHLERARSPDRATDDDQAIPFHQLQGFRRPFFDAVA
jgi:hypothetical protein